MKRSLRRFIRQLLVFMRTALTTNSRAGSGLGVFLRKQLKHFNWQQAIGVNLAGMAFFAGVIVPQSQAALASLEVTLETQETVIIVDTSASKLQWPLRQFGISQYFSYYHPGMDLTDPIGTPVYPIGEGYVTWVEFLPYGYGHHVLVTHDDGMKSLYAHLSRVFVKQGMRLTKKTAIGEVGVTGQSTGSHLHLEIYQDEVPTNPLEVLPAIKQ
jgi:murein DD-endopeptidase MepM/ murein hydrolase activator NlpD